MADLRIETEGNEFTIEAISFNGLAWLADDQEGAVPGGSFAVPDMNEKVYYDLMMQDIITQEIHESGLVIDY